MLFSSSRPAFLIWVWILLRVGNLSCTGDGALVGDGYVNMLPPVLGIEAEIERGTGIASAPAFLR